MNLDKKLQQWVSAGLIDELTRQKIRDHERSGPVKNKWLTALGGLGALSIGLGLISIVASNWDAISAHTKLTADLLLCGLLGAGVMTAHARGNGFAKEALILIYFLFVLASIGLIGQIYQTGAPLYQALWLWLVATTPLVLLGRSRLLAILWVLSILVAYYMSVDALMDHLDIKRLTDLTAILIFLPIPLCWAASTLGFLDETRPKFARTFLHLAWIQLAWFACIAQFVWYEPVNADKNHITWGGVVGILLVLLCTRLVERRHPHWDARAVGSVKLLIVVLGVSCFLPMMIPHPRGMDWVSAGFFMLNCIVAGNAGIRAGIPKLFNFATALIGIRLVIISIEVFGDLFSTGIGLILGGLFTLFVAWVVFKKAPEWRDRLAQG